MKPRTKIPTPGRCLHREAGVCPSCASFGTSVKAAVAMMKKGDRPWTQTFGELNRRAGGSR